MKNIKVFAFNTAVVAILGFASMLQAQVYNEGMLTDPIDVTWADTAIPDGYLRLFDGGKASMQRNFWVSHRAHGNGGYWWVAPDPDLVAAGYMEESDSIMWSDQAPGGNGGILNTHRRFGNHETRMLMKLGYGNDGGIFMRCDGGRAWQVVLDYQEGSRIMEFFDEGTGSGSPRTQTYRLRTNGSTIDPPDRFSKPWSEMWNPNGINEVWAKIMDNRPTINTSISGEPVMVNWLAANEGTSLDDDYMGYLGLQIHAGEGEWHGGPNKYYRIDVRVLDNVGMPTYPVMTSYPPELLPMELGASATLTVATADVVTYQWQKNGIDIPGANTASLSIGPVTGSEAGVYDGIITNAAGNATRSRTAVVTGVALEGASLQNKLNALRLTWLDRSAGQLQIASGNFAKGRQLMISDMKGAVACQFSSGSGVFSETVRLPASGMYFLSVKGDPSIAPVRIQNIAF